MNITLTEDFEDKNIFLCRICFCSTLACAWSRALAYVDAHSKHMSHTSLHFFVLSVVLACAHACVASENQAQSLKPEKHLVTSAVKVIYTALSLHVVQ
jgi:hypothetical protein